MQEWLLIGLIPLDGALYTELNAKSYSLYEMRPGEF